jgi:hypothetical protein
MLVELQRMVLKLVQRVVMLLDSLRGYKVRLIADDTDCETSHILDNVSYPQGRDIIVPVQN